MVTAGSTPPRRFDSLKAANEWIEATFDDWLASLTTAERAALDAYRDPRPCHRHGSPDAQDGGLAVTDSPRNDRADRFTTRSDDYTLHRAPGKPPLPGVERQTTRPAGASSPGRTLGLGTIRRERGLTQAILAEHMGVGQDQVSRVERRATLPLAK